MPRAPSRYDDGRSMREHLLEKLERGFRKLPSGCWVCDTSFVCGQNGYRQVMITLYGVRHREYIHRLSYEKYHGVIPSDHDVCHSCDNPPCWNPEHLFSGTRTVNMRDMSLKERGPHGESHPFAKLSEDDVLEMYRQLDDGVSQYQIAKAFGVHERYANLIFSGRRWKHLYRRHRA
jgi:HNH endonuclease